MRRACSAAAFTPAGSRGSRFSAAARCRLVGALFTTDSLQPLAWLAIGVCIIKAERDDEPRWWLAAGVIAGVAFLAKYTVALYLVSLAARASA